jgi:hypothetical protein
MRIAVYITSFLIIFIVVYVFGFRWGYISKYFHNYKFPELNHWSKRKYNRFRKFFIEKYAQWIKDKASGVYGMELTNTAMERSQAFEKANSGNTDACSNLNGRDWALCVVKNEGAENNAKHVWNNSKHPLDYLEGPTGDSWVRLWEEYRLKHNLDKNGYPLL